MFKEFLSSFKPKKKEEKYRFDASNFDISSESQKEEVVLKKDDSWKSGVVKSLMSGLSKNWIIAKYTNGVRDDKKRGEIVSYVNRYFGLIGTIIVDCSKIERSSSYKKMPNRKYHCYAINCNCYKEKTIRKSRITSGGNLDNVLKANEIVETKAIKICQKTGLPVISSFKEVEGACLDGLVKQLVHEGSLGVVTAKAIKASNNKLVALKKYFVDRNSSKIIKDEMPIIDKEYRVYGLKEQDIEEKIVQPNEDLEIDTIRIPTKISEPIKIDENEIGDVMLETQEGVPISLSNQERSIDVNPVGVNKLDNCPVFDSNEIFVLIKPLEASVKVDVSKAKVVKAKIEEKKTYNVTFDDTVKELDIDGEQNDDWI